MREISSLPLSNINLNALIEAGFTSVDDLDGMQVLDLRKETGLSLEEANAVLQCARVYMKTKASKPVGNALKQVLCDTSVLNTTLGHIASPRNDSSNAHLTSIEIRSRITSEEASRTESNDHNGNDSNRNKNTSMAIPTTSDTTISESNTPNVNMNRRL